MMKMEEQKMEGWDTTNSPTYRTLKFILRLMSVFCLYREFNVKGSRLVCHILYASINIVTWLLFAVRIIWCFIGAENVMTPRNGIINGVMLAVTIFGALYIIFGFFFLPGKMKKFLQSCDELRLDPMYQVSYMHIERRIKILITVCIVFMTLSVVLFLYTNPILFDHSGSVNCLQSPILDKTNWLYIFNGILYMFTVFIFCGHKMVVPLFFYTMCSMLKLELVRCNEEFLKCVDTVVSEKKIQEIKSRYFKITELIIEADGVLLVFTSLSIIVDVAPICAYIHAFIYVLSDITEITGYAFVCFMAFIDMLIFLVQGTILNEKSLDCLETAKLIDTTKLNQKTLSALVLFVENMKGSKVGISVMKLFILDKSAILTICGTLISYIIVIIQFKPT